MDETGTDLWRVNVGLANNQTRVAEQEYGGGDLRASCVISYDS